MKIVRISDAKEEKIEDGTREAGHGARLKANAKEARDEGREGQQWQPELLSAKNE
jgi:hypothetical protein